MVALMTISMKGMVAGMQNIGLIIKNIVLTIVLLNF